MTLPRVLQVDWKRQNVSWAQDDSAMLWRRRLYFSDFAAAATTGNKDIASFPGGLLIEGAFFWLITNFTGGGAATATLSAGTTGSAAAYVAATDVFAGARKAIVGLTLVPGTFLNASVPTDSATVRFALVASVNTNLLTTGSVDVYLRLRAASLEVS